MDKIFYGSVLWIVCGLIAAGGFNAQLGHTFCSDRRHDIGFSITLGLLGGPVSLVVATLVTGVFAHGWTLDEDCGKNHE